MTVSHNYGTEYRSSLNLTLSLDHVVEAKLFSAYHLYCRVLCAKIH